MKIGYGEAKRGYGDVETCFNYCNEQQAFFSSDERRWITKVRKLKESYPDEVEIIRQPEDNDGCIYAKVPARWLRVQPPQKRILTDERKERLREQLRTLRESS